MADGTEILERTAGTHTRAGSRPEFQRPTLVGNCLAIREIRSAVDLVAGSSTAVLITGETGTGKGVVARLVHAGSKRAHRPFIAVHCASLPKVVIEDELFGHEHVSSTGALPKKVGCLELADRGTLFIDEIAEMNFDAQGKLLRAIGQKAFRRLGGEEDIQVDVRMVAATSKNIPQALKAGALREDLYYRFSIIEINLPPLRDRREDIPLFVDHFLAIFRMKFDKPNIRFSHEAIEKLTNYNWPGNVRELRNVIERCVLTCPDDIVSPALFPARILSHDTPATRSITIPVGIPMAETQRRIIAETLAATGQNKSEAARLLGLSRRGLQKKLKRLDLT